jgi:acyl-CoA dehydrogenase
MAWFLKVIVLPRGARAHGPSDKLARTCAELLLEPSETRDRLTPNINRGKGKNGVGLLEAAFRLVVETEPLQKKLKQARIRDISEALAAGVLSNEEAETLGEAAAAVGAVVAVDDFAPSDLTPSSRDEEPEAATTG